jgi:hypothetical protein
MTTKTDRLHVSLGASQVRRRLKGHGFGVKKVETAGKKRAVIIHTAIGETAHGSLLERPCPVYGLAPGESIAEVARKAHWLKGSVGFDILTHPEAELEKAAKAGQSQAVNDWLDRIERIVAHIVAGPAPATATV